MLLIAMPVNTVTLATCGMVDLGVISNMMHLLSYSTPRGPLRSGSLL